MLLEKFAELHRARIEHYLNLVKISIEDAERLGEMRWDSARESLEKNIEIAHAMSAARDITELFRLSKELSDFKLEEAWVYPLSIYQKTLEIQAELSRLIEESLTAYGIVIAQSMESNNEEIFADGELKAASEAGAEILVQLDGTATQAANIASTSLNLAMTARSNADRRARP